MMDIFYPHCDVKGKEFIYIEYNKNKFIDGHMIYVIGEYYLKISFEIETSIPDE